ncbi:MAG: hypothetical protein OXR72_09445, partial [Gemmatimonadota bacterium]|nr:hypothetical protein [Gemmatimonadota bacterium]
EFSTFTSISKCDFSEWTQDWLDLSNTEDKAKLAKAAIALANHGGRYIVIGFGEVDQLLKSGPIPERVPQVTQDLVNQAINRFAEPELQCNVHNIPHPDTEVLHPVIVVPGELTTPIMSKRLCEGIIRQHRCYIRKPGPKSEEPKTSDEWRRLLRRCVVANKDELLDAIRTALAGNIEETEVKEPDETDKLRSFVRDARAYWKKAVAKQPTNSPLRFPHGYYEISISLLNPTPPKDVSELQTHLYEAGQINHTGWPVFPILRNSDWAPFPDGDSINAHIGKPIDDEETTEETHHCNFWRASLDGKLYAICGYREDSQEQPGRVLYDSSLIWRLGEGILFVNRYMSTFDKIEQVILQFHFTGLMGRHIADAEIPSLRRDFYVSKVEEYRVGFTVKSEEIENNLAEVIHAILKRLYGQFNFYPLNVEFVAKELQDLRKNNYY